MTCHDVTMTSQTSHFEFWGRHLESLSCRHTVDNDDIENIWISFKKHTKSKQAQKSKVLSSSYNEGEKLKKKKTEKRPRVVKIHSWIDDCYGNVNHHRHVIDIRKFSLINFGKSHDIWWLFVELFKRYNSLKSARAQLLPPPPWLNRVTKIDKRLWKIIPDLNINMKQHLTFRIVFVKLNERK